MKLSFVVICGWINLFLIPLVVLRFISTRTFYARWVIYSGEAARNALIIYILIGIILAGYSISETVKLFRKKKIQESPNEPFVNDVEKEKR